MRGCSVMLFSHQYDRVFSIFLSRCFSTNQPIAIHCAAMPGMPRLQQGGFWVIKVKIADYLMVSVNMVKKCCG